MAKRSPRLIFTEEERALPELERAVRKADRAAVKLEKAEAKIPKKTVKVKKRVVDSESGKVTTRLFFEEADKKRPPSKLAHAARKAPLDTVRSAVHRKLREEGDDNPGTEAANTLTETAERTWRIAESAHRSHAEKPYRGADKAEAAADKANLKALNKQYEQEYGRASNPYSRWQQKQAIKKEYAAAKAGNGARNTVKASETTAKAAGRAAEGSKELGSFFVRHKKGFLIAGGIAAAILLLMTCISSCSTLFQGGASGIAASTYPLEDADMLAAEAAYCAMEDELREYLNSYESTHDYDEYHFDLDEIEHDPYVLISMITALKGGEWTIDEIGGILETLFEKQYILTETVATETRYRTETHIGYYTDENGKEYEAYGFTYGGIVKATPLLRLQYSWYQTMDYVRIVRLSLQMLLSGAAGVNDLSGPVGIVSTITEVGKETEAEAGFGAAMESILYFAAMIAVNLAVMNLLPLPALDGGHVLFLLVNGIAVLLFKKEVPSKYLNVINGIGFALLMALMLFVTFHDIIKLL